MYYLVFSFLSVWFCWQYKWKSPATHKSTIFKMKIQDHLRQRLSYSRFKTICGKAEINLVETNTLILCGVYIYIYFYLQALSFIYWILIITIIHIVLYAINKRVRKQSHWHRWEIHFNLYEVLNQTVIIYKLKFFTVMNLCAIVQKICMLYHGCTMIVK